MTRRVLFTIGALTGLLFVGTVGYIILADMTLLEAVFMTVTTISTVGYEIVKPLDPAGMVFTVFLILIGVGVLFYSLGTIMELFFEGFLVEIMEGRRKQRMYERLRNHYIVAGYGRVGEQICHELSHVGVTFVVIERREERARSAERDGHLVFEGDATDEEALEMLNLKKAKGLVACVGTDPENVFITLTARSVNSDLFIVARANALEAEAKLYKAGADRVISPAILGGRRMAAMLVKPTVAEYLDVVTHGEGVEFQLDEYQIDEHAPLCGDSIGGSDIRTKSGVLILAIRYPSGVIDTNPVATTVIEPGQEIIALGTKDQLRKFERLFLGRTFTEPA